MDGMSVDQEGQGKVQPEYKEMVLEEPEKWLYPGALKVDVRQGLPQATEGARVGERG